MIFFREFTAVIVIGIAVAFFNYLMNSVITEHAMNASKGAIWILLGAVARIAIAGAVAFILYKENRYNIIAYITGYSLHYVAVVISATSQRNKIKREGE
jgi:ATP synthase protein I